MISYTSFQLDNGLTVYVHEDHSVDIAVMNILYDVGSRDEQPHKTGFAHLFEHLMFGGSRNIPSYDEPLQRVGGENNAFTSTDITNYYLTVPAANLETGFWLESDRMLSLSFDPAVLEAQRGVVVEEFRQRYLNQPYGDVWLKLRPLAYQVHPYQWATIGKEVAHIEQATMEDVKDFFSRFYRPSNAVLVVAGKVTHDQVRTLSEKWFATIPSGPKPIRSIPKEPAQQQKRTETVDASVPAHALYKAYHMSGRFEKDFYAADLLGDVMGRGHSSRLYEGLVRKKKMFTGISVYSTGTVDPGLWVVSGRLAEGVRLPDAEEAVDEMLQHVVDQGVTEEELEKVKTQAEAALSFERVEVMNRAMNLAFSSLSGDASLVNREADTLRAVTLDDVARMAKLILQQKNGSALYYHSKSKN